MKHNYIFTYGTMLIFLFGIIMYIYEIVIDSQDPDSINREFSETIWIWALFILLIVGFILSSYLKLSD